MAQCDAAARVNNVVPDLPNVWLTGECGVCFGDQLVRERGCFPADGPVWALRVIEVTELVQGVLELLNGVGWMLGVTLSAKWRDILIAVWRPQSVHS